MRDFRSGNIGGDVWRGGEERNGSWRRETTALSRLRDNKITEAIGRKEKLIEKR